MYASTAWPTNSWRLSPRFVAASFASMWILPSSEQHVYSALRFINESQPARAVSEATAAVESDLSSARASYVLAAILEETGETNKAITESERCLALDSVNGDCRFQLGISLLRLRGRPA